MSEEIKDSKQKLELNPVQVVASALAAVTSAVLLSTLGTAGTFIGAALGSLIFTSGSAIYAYSLRVGRERVAAAQAAAIAKVNRRRVGESTTQVDVAERPVDAGRPPWREALSRLPWKWIAILAGAIFVVTMLVIIGFELLTGRSVSTYTGGTDGGGHRTSLGFSSSTKASQSPSPTPTPSSNSSSEPSGDSSQAPGVSTTPTTTAAPRQSAPSSSPSASVPTPSSSATPSSTPTPSSSPSD